jgi:hypothetical protein
MAMIVNLCWLLASTDRHAALSKVGTTNRVIILWLIIIFGDSGSLQHNSNERVEGEKLENPY